MSLDKIFEPAFAQGKEPTHDEVMESIEKEGKIIKVAVVSAQVDGEVRKFLALPDELEGLIATEIEELLVSEADSFGCSITFREMSEEEFENMPEFES